MVGPILKTSAGTNFRGAKRATQIHHLIAIAYEDETIAWCATEEVERCAENLSIDPDAASVLICDRNGKCHLTTSRRPHATAMLAVTDEVRTRAMDNLSSFGGEAMSSPLGDDLPKRWGVTGLGFSG